MHRTPRAHANSIFDRTERIRLLAGMMPKG
jgi:hypothetical protein